MVVDAQVVVSVRDAGAQEARNEILYPTRHRITLPLNGLNFIFDNSTCTFNQTNQLAADKWVKKTIEPNDINVNNWNLKTFFTV